MTRSLPRRRRTGATNGLYLVVLVALGLLVGLGVLLMRHGDGPSAAGDGDAARLQLFCAAGMRKPVEAARIDYELAYGVRVDVQYEGSNTLLSKLDVHRSGDLYLAADDGYTEIARGKGLVAETIPIAAMTPVIAVAKGNPKGVKGVADLLRDDVKVALGNPDQAAVGKHTRDALRDAGLWQRVEAHVTRTGVFKPTVPEVANDIKLGAVDAGVIWSATVAQYPELEAVHSPELERYPSRITLGVTTFSDDPTAALRFARFLTARDRGLEHFAALGYQPVDGDVWEVEPQITFFAGSVNRRALEPIVRRFERREGVTVNTVYNGCGILTAQMKTIRDQEGGGFPDTYMACDTYYLDTVADWFHDGTDVSETDIVIVVAEGNPKGIATPDDLAKPGVRLAVGQPDQCTIGVLSRRLLEGEGLYQALLDENIVTQTATSAMLVPAVTTGSADAALAYRTDTFAEAERVDAIDIDSPLARAVQPFAVARSSDHKHLGDRLFDMIRRSRDSFEAAGFRWKLNGAAVAGGTESVPAP